MRKLTIIALLLSSSLGFSEPAGKAGEDSGKWIPLFNGKDLSGWTPKFAGSQLGTNPGEAFRVRDGKLVLDYSKWEKFNGEFGHLFHKDTFSHYKLRAEYRFVGTQVKGGPGWARRNNGLMIHGQTAESMENNQKFPDSIEVQLLGGLGQGPRPTANLIMVGGCKALIDGKPNKTRITNSSSETFDGDQWVTVELEVHGSELIKHFVNGKLVMEATKFQKKDGTPLDKGTISIQAETAPIEFRKIAVMPLTNPTSKK